MAFKDCLEVIQKAAGRELTHDEAEEIYSALEREMLSMMRKGMPEADAARAAGKSIAERSRKASLEERRSAAINAVVYENLQGRRVEGREADAVYAIVNGFQGGFRRPGNFRNAGLSVDALGNTAEYQAKGMLVADLERAGLFKAVARRDPTFERDMIRELWRWKNPENGAATGNKHAADAAGILGKHLNLARMSQNEAGAAIGEILTYIGRQGHDAYKIRGAGFDAWRAKIEPNLDARSFDGMDTPADVTKFLRETYQALGSGVHDEPGDWLAFKGPGNLAKRVSQSRSLHFKSADAWLEYNADFGTGNAFDSILHGIGMGQRNAAVMRVMGTNPNAMLERLVKDWEIQARDRGDLKMAAQLARDFPQNNRLLDRAMKKTIDVRGQTLANVGAVTRNIQSLRLGSSMISSFQDIASLGSTARHNGAGAIESYSRSIIDLLPTDSTARRELAYEAGFLMDKMNSSMMNRFMAIDGPEGKAAGLARLHMKLSGQPWWSAEMKESFGMSTAHRVARNADKEFSALPGRWQTTMRRYGIEDAEWNALRAVKGRAADGNDYILAGDIMNLPDDAVAGLVSPTRSANAARRELADKYGAYLNDQVNEGMSEPTPWVRDFMAGGSASAGSAVGEAWRTAMQFKSFTASFMVRSMTRELFRDGVDVGGLAKLIVGSTVMGYVSYQLKQIAAGREPRTAQEPGDYRKLLFASMLQGGGLGLFGDFLFGEVNRFGGDIGDSLTGPTVQTMGDAQKVWAALVEGDVGKAGAEAVRIPQGFNTLWWARTALNALVFWQIQELLNPGFARRFEDGVRRNNNQGMLLGPMAVTQ